MKILLTNDDGIYAPGLYALYQQLRRIGDVTVVAPEGERSSVGHGITLSQPLWCKKIKLNRQLTGLGVSGTPADCVKFALRVVLKKKPDLIVSGINLGSNDGCSVFYSGTVAAAREAALMGIPGLALSLATFVNPDFTYAARIGVRIAKMIRDNRLPIGTFLSVNIPNKSTSRIKGIRVTRQCLVPIHSQFRRKFDPHLREYFWMSGKIPQKTSKKDTDTFCLDHNYITVTPLHCDLTDERFFERIQRWKF